MPMKTILNPSSKHIGQTGRSTKIINSSVTRPANTTAYAAGDAASDSTTAPTVVTATGCARIDGGSGTIIRGLLIDSANQVTPGDFEVWVFDTTFTATNDNAAFAPTDAELATLVGVITFDTEIISNAGSGAAGSLIYRSGEIALPFDCLSGSKDLYWQLVVRNTYTPVSAEAFTLRLAVQQD